MVNNAVTNARDSPCKSLIKMNELIIELQVTVAVIYTKTQSTAIWLL